MKRGNITLLLIALIAGASCAPKGRSLDSMLGLADRSGLKLVQTQGSNLVYVRPDEPTFKESYRFIVDLPQVQFSDETSRKLDPDELKRVQRYLRERMVTELRSGGYEITGAVSPNTMRISLRVLNLRAPSAWASRSAVVIPFPSVRAESATVEAVFSDAVSGRTDAVVIDRSVGAPFLNGKPWSTWADVEDSFNQWIRRIRKVVDEAHGKP